MNEIFEMGYIPLQCEMYMKKGYACTRKKKHSVALNEVWIS